jgi:hypothetical protein
MPEQNICSVAMPSATTHINWGGYTRIKLHSTVWWMGSKLLSLSTTESTRQIHDSFTFFTFLFFFGISNFFDLSITEETWVVKMRIWCITIDNVVGLHFNPWVEVSAGGLLVPEGLYSTVAKYFGICFQIRICMELSRKIKFYKFIWERRINSLRHSSILRRICPNFMALWFSSNRSFTVFTFLFFGFPIFSIWASLKRLQ